MKRGGIRTHRIYTTKEDGSRTIQYGLQGKKRNIWVSIVETINEKQELMVYETLQEAEKQLKAIVGQVRRKNEFKRR
jgi:DNA-binding PadR family transcriptional regulator